MSFGFRPFFLGGAIWAAVAVALWPALLAGVLTLPTTFSPLQWHVHELIYGYVPAVITGFLLTAVPNWTGRLPVVGTRLLILFFMWVMGRAAVALSVMIGPITAAIIDVCFLVSVCAVVAREIIAGSNFRNLKILAVVGLLCVGNAIFHFEAVTDNDTGLGARMGVATVVLLIIIIGGRIIPSFTRNWLVRREQGRLPVPFAPFDVAAIAIGGIALACWVGFPGSDATAWACLAAGAVHLGRLVRWVGWRTTAEPLVLVLHVAYFFIPAGFVCIFIGHWQSGLIAQSAALHAWTMGAIGLMTLAVMTRASLGHTGRPLSAGVVVKLIYALAIIAVAARLVAAANPGQLSALHFSAMAWVLAFALFAVTFFPLLARRKPID